MEQFPPPEQSGSDDIDREIRESIRIIQSQRNTKRVAVLVGLVLALVVAGAAVYLAYADTPDAAKTTTSTNP